MLDLIVRNASLAGGVRAGRIAAVEPRLQAAAGETIDAHGRCWRRRSSTPMLWPATKS